LIYSIDGNSMLAVAESLVTKGDFTVPAALGRLGRDGNYYCISYPLESIVAVPFVALGYSLAYLLRLPPHYVAAVLTLVLSALWITASAYLTGMLALRLGGSGRGAILASVAFGLGTIAPVYTRDFYADPLVTFFTATTIFLALGQTGRENAAAGVATALAVLAKPSTVILGPLVSLYNILKERSLYRAVIPLLGTAIGLLFFLFYNKLRFGALTDFGYGNSKAAGFTTRYFPKSAIAYLISPGRGIVWYCPPIMALLGLKRREFARPEVLLILAVAAGYWLLYSFWHDWAGGWAWGPRFLVPVLPGLLALAGLLSSRWLKVLMVLTLVGFLNNAPNLVCFFARYDTEFVGTALHLQPGQELSLEYRWPPIGIWRTAYEEIHDAQGADVQSIVRDAGKPNETPGRWRAFRTVAVWWWILPALGIPRLFGVGIACLLVGIGAALIAHALLRSTSLDFVDAGGQVD